MIKVLLLGSNGLLAQNLAVYAPNQVSLVGISKSSENKSPGLSQYHSLDLTQFNLLHQYIEEIKPQLIINTAALTNVDACEDQLELATQVNFLLANELAKLKIPIIHYSTDYVFDGKNGPYRETDHTNPLGHYGKTKLDSEEPILQSDSQSLVLRTMLLWGRGQGGKTSFTEFVKSKLQKGEPVSVVTDQWGNPTLVSQLAQVTWKLWEKKIGGLFHVSGSECMSRFEWATKVADFYGLPFHLIHPCTTAELKQKAPRPLKSGFHLEKLRGILGEVTGDLEQQLIAYQEEEKDQFSTLAKNKELF